MEKILRQLTHIRLRLNSTAIGSTAPNYSEFLILTETHERMRSPPASSNLFHASVIVRNNSNQPIKFAGMIVNGHAFQTTKAIPTGVFGSPTTLVANAIDSGSDKVIEPGKGTMYSLRVRHLFFALKPEEKSPTPSEGDFAFKGELLFFAADGSRYLAPLSGNVHVRLGEYAQQQQKERAPQPSEP